MMVSVRLPLKRWQHRAAWAGMLFGVISACAPVVASPATTAPYITQTPLPAIQVIATSTPRSIGQPRSATPAPTQTVLGTRLSVSAVPSQAILSPTEAGTGERLIGLSAEGRAITAYRFGGGGRVLALVGGIHGGYELNTVRLLDEMRRLPGLSALIPSGTALVIIPALNPDGVARGQGETGRFNARGVDLNRNWACAWSPQARWRDQAVNPGDAPMSEPETQALAAYLLSERPAALLSFHSAANGVFEGDCSGEGRSAGLARVFGEAAPYPYAAAFAAYPVTGTLAEWADGQGIMAADVELINQTDTDFDRNWRGVIAVLNWLAEG